MTLKTLIGTTVNNAISDKNILNKAYDDALHPAAKNIGKALGTLTSTLNALLTPIGWAVYGFEQIDKVVKESLEHKLSKVPIENLKEPEANIVIPAYESLRYSLNKEQLKDMYINLIANSMQDDKADNVHPAFVSVVNQLSSFDAEFLRLLFYNKDYQLPKIKIRLQVSKEDTSGIDLLRTLLSPLYFSDCSLLDKYSFSLDNLERLKIIEIHDDYFLSEPNIYDDIIKSIDTDSFLNERDDLNYVNLIKGSIYLTKFGEQFVNSVF